MRGGRSAGSTSNDAGCTGSSSSTPAAPEPDALLAARLDCALLWHRLLHGTPDRLEIARDGCPGLGALSDVLTTEAQAARCGRLKPLHGFSRRCWCWCCAARLALPRRSQACWPVSRIPLHRALVAIHDNPAKPWTTQELATEAGMSDHDSWQASLSSSGPVHLPM